jgi:hypothetical protein
VEYKDTIFEGGFWLTPGVIHNWNPPVLDEFIVGADTVPVGQA